MIVFFHLVIVLSICCCTIQGSYLIATVAGNGSRVSSGNGGPATSAGISYFFGLWVDSVGNIFFPDGSAFQLRKVDTAGIINRFIGSGKTSNNGNGGPALSVDLDGLGCPYGDTAGNIYLTSNQYFIWYYNHASGQVSRFAGVAPTNPGYSGDGGPATSAQIYAPLGVFLSTTGILYFADTGNGVIRAIDTQTNIITTFAGSKGNVPLGDGGPATSANLIPFGVWGNTAGVVYIGDYGNNRIRKVATNGIITTVVGTGQTNFNGDDISATNANLNSPQNCQEDSLGNLYLTSNSLVRMVSVLTGNITTIAGNGNQSLPQITDGLVHVATAVTISPSMIQLDSLGNIYFGDGPYVRKLFAAPTAIPSTAPSAVPTEINPSTEDSSRSQRLSNLHIFYATFFPAFFVVFCVLLPVVGYYFWKLNKGTLLYANSDEAYSQIFYSLDKKESNYGEINFHELPVTANRDENKIVKVEKYYKWSF